MADLSEQASVERRATWIGLRTLRQRPKIVDHTPEGAPVFEVRSVRLFLHDDAAHFNRLEQCAKCGRQVSGPPVLGPADLDRPGNTVVCKDCVRAATISPSWQGRDRRPPNPSPAPPAVAEEPPGAEAVAAAGVGVDERAAGNGRMAAVEAQLQAAVGRLGELGDVQRSESSERRGAEEALQSRLRAALVQGWAEMRAEVAASAEAAAARAVGEVGELLRAQRAELATLSGALAETRSEIVAVAESNRELARVQADLEHRLAELGRHVSSGAAGGGAAEVESGELRAALAAGLAEVRAEVTASAEVAAAGLAGLERDVRQGAAEVVDLRESQGAGTAALAQAITDARAELSVVVDGHRALGEAQAEVERRMAEMGAGVGAGAAGIDEAEARLTGAIESRHAELERVVADALAQSRAAVASLEQQLRGELESAASVDAELRLADRQLDGRLDGLAEQVARAVGGLAEVTASSQAGANRLQALEHDLHDAVARLTSLLEETGPPGGSGGGGVRPPPPAADDVMEALERQLQEAAGRIARFATSSSASSGD